MSASGPHGVAMSGRVFILLLGLAALLVILSFIALSLFYPSDESDAPSDVAPSETRVEFSSNAAPAATATVPAGR